MNIAKNKPQPGEWSYEEAERQAFAVEGLAECAGWKDYLLPMIEKSMGKHEADALEGDHLTPEEREAARNKRNALRQVVDAPAKLLDDARERMSKGRTLKALTSG